MPMLPKAKPAAKAAQGRKEWTPGDKLWGGMLIHGSAQFMTKYLPIPTFADSGESSAIFGGLGEPQVWSNPDTLASKLAVKNTEILNRPPVGLSEYAGTMETLNQVFVERPCSVAKSWKRLWEQNEMGDACKVLNSYGYPHLARSPDDLVKAVQRVLQFSGELRTIWTAASQEQAAAATKVTGLSWALEMSALTIPGQFAEKLQSVKTEKTQEHAELMAKPLSGRALRDYLVAEVSHLATSRSSSSGAPPPAPIPEPTTMLTFSDDEGSKAAAADPAPAVGEKKKKRPRQPAAEVDAEAESPEEKVPKKEKKKSKRVVEEPDDADAEAEPAAEAVPKKEKKKKRTERDQE